MHFSKNLKHFIVDETKVMRNDHVDVRKKIKDYDSPLEYSSFDFKVSNVSLFYLLMISVGL